MKASLRFRDEQKPLVRAKIPVGILGLPFLSGVSAGEARELRLDLATAFDSGPSLRLSYRPNDHWNPFTLAVKTGAPAVTMSAEFNLAGPGGPSFTLQIKPRFGDFCVKKSTSSYSAAPFVMGGTVVVDHVAGGEASIDGSGFPTGGGVFAGKKPNGISAGVPAGGIWGLMSGAEVTARSVLPLRNRAAVKFRWGVRIPPDLRSPFLDPIAGVSLRKLPFLVMSKVSVEHVRGEVAPREKLMDVAGTCFSSVQRQLAALQAENGMLRQAVEEMRADLGARGPRLLASGGEPIAAGEGYGPDAWGRKAGKGDRHGAGEAPSVKDGGSAVNKEEVNEELRRALLGAAGAGI